MQEQLLIPLPNDKKIKELEEKYLVKGIEIAIKDYPFLSEHLKNVRNIKKALRLYVRRFHQKR